MRPNQRLLTLFREVEERAETLLTQHPGWPCRRGCDACCRALARVPELTRSEFELLSAALEALPEPERTGCLRRAEALAEHVREHGDQGPLTCPLLDTEAGACRVYPARPLACRSYGFYAGRSHDAWCQDVAAHVAPARDHLVVGNYDALERDLTRCDGERRDLLTWLGRAARR
jgi:Fe-S-cluster containining protein